MIFMIMYWHVYVVLELNTSIFQAFVKSLAENALTDIACSLFLNGRLTVLNVY